MESHITTPLWSFSATYSFASRIATKDLRSYSIISNFEDVAFYHLNPPSIIVDDSNPAIRYNGTWNTPNKTDIQDAAFVQRVPIFNTLHVLQIFNGSFSYNFTGVGVSVFATQINNSSYTTQCFLDGVPLNFDPNAQSPMFGQSRPVCAAFELPGDSAHTISVFVSVPPRDRKDKEGPLSGFAFDYMLIQPVSAESAWENGGDDLFLPILDLASMEGSPGPKPLPTIDVTVLGKQMASVTRGWKYDSSSGFHTTTNGPQFNITFAGTSLWWYGYYELTGPLNFPLATFSVDGAEPSSFFTMDQVYLTVSQAYFFNTSVIQNATHRLTVVYHGSNDTIPLKLQSFIIQRSLSEALAPSSTVGPSTSTSISGLPTSPLTSRHTNLSGIAGGIGGGVVFLLIVVFGAYASIWRKRRNRPSIQTETQSALAVPEPFPTPTDGTAPILSPRKVRASQYNTDNPFMHQVLEGPPLTKWARRTQIADSPEHSFRSSGSILHERPRAGSTINVPLVPTNDSRPGLTGSETTNGPPVPNISPDEGERGEDSGLRMAYVPVLPPVYTTH